MSFYGNMALSNESLSKTFLGDPKIEIRGAYWGNKYEATIRRLQCNN